MYGSSVLGTEFRVFEEPGTGTDNFWNREPKIRVPKGPFWPIFSPYSLSSELVIALTVREGLLGTRVVQ